MDRQAKFLVLCLFVGLFSANLCDEGESWIKLNRIEIKLKTRNTHFSIMHPHTHLHLQAYVCANTFVGVCVWGGFLNGNSYIEYQFSGHFLFLRLGVMFSLKELSETFSKPNL